MTPISLGKYKVYAGDGNNGQLVIRLLKSKGWVATDDINEAHLCWTQLPNREVMKKIEQSESIQLREKAKLNSNYFSTTAEIKNEQKEAKNFLKYKNNNFFEACSKLLHPLIYNKIVSEIAQKFMANQNVKLYQFVRDTIPRFLLSKPTEIFEAKSLTVCNHCEHSK